MKTEKLQRELMGVERRRSIMKGTINDLPSMTQKQFEQETDINRIMKKYHSTGMITHLAQNPGRYADLTQIKDYAGSLQNVIDAENAFMTLPSETRFRFQNNPQELINFLADVKNRDEAIRLKLIDPPPLTTPETPPQKTPISTTKEKTPISTT